MRDSTKLIELFQKLMLRQKKDYTIDSKNRSGFVDRPA